MQQHFFLLVRLVGNVRASAYGVADFGRSSENIWHGFIVLSGVGFRGSRGFPLRKSLSRRSLDGVFALSIGEASCPLYSKTSQKSITSFSYFHHFRIVLGSSFVSRLHSAFVPSGCASCHSCTITFFSPLPFGRPFLFLQFLFPLSSSRTKFIK